MNNQLILILLIFIIIYLFIKNSNACSNFHRNEREEFDVGAKLKNWQVGVGLGTTALFGAGAIVANKKNENKKEWEKLRDVWIEKYPKLFGVLYGRASKTLWYDNMKNQYKNQLVPFTPITQVTIKLPIDIFKSITLYDNRLAEMQVDKRKLVIGISDKTIELAINAMINDNTYLNLLEEKKKASLNWSSPDTTIITDKNGKPVGEYIDNAIDYYDKAHNSLLDDFIYMTELKHVEGLRTDLGAPDLLVKDNMGIKVDKTYDDFLDLIKELSSHMKYQARKYKDRADSISNQYRKGRKGRKSHTHDPSMDWWEEKLKKSDTGGKPVSSFFIP